LITILLGTNDLSLGTSPVAVVRLLGDLVQQLLSPRDPPVGGMVGPLSTELCDRTVVLATLLPRSSPEMMRRVDEVNDAILLIDSCKRQNFVGGTDCAIKCFSGHQSTRIGAQARAALCHRCVAVADIGRTHLLNSSSVFMYDGLHPNAYGEQQVASLFMAELIAKTPLFGS
jgi:hypothetical protein